MSSSCDASLGCAQPRKNMEPAREEYRCFICIFFFLLLCEAAPSNIKTVFVVCGMGDEELNYCTYSLSCHIPVFHTVLPLVGRKINLGFCDLLTIRSMSLPSRGWATQANQSVPLPGLLEEDKIAAKLGQ